jgi:hypothetical protein
MKPVLNVIFISVLCCSCQPVNHGRQSDEDKLSQLSWMLGKWEMKTPEGVIMEEWVRPSDTQWQGVSYMVTPAGDTPFRESIRLNYERDTLYYQPVVSDQNDGEEVSFTEKNFSDHEITFENLRHDFPQRIIYKRLSDTTIIATIEGNQNGQERREEFRYVKSH